MIKSFYCAKKLCISIELIQSLREFQEKTLAMSFGFRLLLVLAASEQRHSQLHEIKADTYETGLIDCMTLN